VARPEVAVEATADVPAVEDAAAGLAAASA
jgi:hypothetical protein